MNYPFVSILVPTTIGRVKFLHLLMKNVKSQTYPHDKMELVVIGDQNLQTKREFENMFFDLKGIRCRYIPCNIHNNIGSKRNFACTKASYDIIVNMDDDDIYNKSYIEYSIKSIQDMNVDIVGCRDMIITWPSLDFETRYVVGTSIHEGTMVFKKKHWKKYKFRKSTYAEGSQMVNGRYFNQMDIKKIMMCVSHGTNTYDKIDLLKKGAIVSLSESSKDSMRKLVQLK